MKSDTAFMIPIFTHSVENWSDYKEEIINMLDTGDGDGHKTDYFKYHQQGKLPAYAERLFDILQPALKEFDDIYPHAFQITNVWGQKYNNGDYHQLHNHGALGYTAILYAQLEDDHSPTSFFAPFLDFIEGNVIEYMPEVSEGDIVFFPSCLTHQCKVVQSSTERVVFSFNIRNA